MDMQAEVHVRQVVPLSRRPSIEFPEQLYLNMGLCSHKQNSVLQPNEQGNRFPLDFLLQRKYYPTPDRRL